MSMSPRISVNIVTYNSMDHLPDLLRSLFAQTSVSFWVRIIDNGSCDQVATFIRETYPQVTFLRNARNLGWGAAHNQGMTYTLEKWGDNEREHQYILVLDPQMILTPSCLETMVACLEEDLKRGSVTGKYLRAYGEHVQDEALRNIVCSDHLESAGIRLQRNGRMVIRGQGEMDEGQYENAQEVFAVDGHCCLYRASALLDTKEEGGFFDADFFSGLESLDLAWRLKARGWTCWYESQVKAYRYQGIYRTGSEKEKKEERRYLRQHLFFYQMRNYAFLLYKNLSWGDVLRNSYRYPWQLSRLFLGVLRHPSHFFLYLAIFRAFPRLWKKRRAIQAHRTSSFFEIFRHNV